MIVNDHTFQSHRDSNYSKQKFLLVWVIIGGGRANNWECWVDDTNERQARGHRKVYDRVLTAAACSGVRAQAIPGDCWTQSPMTYILRSVLTIPPHGDLTSCEEMASNLVLCHPSIALLHLRRVPGVKQFTDSTETIKIKTGLWFKSDQVTQKTGSLYC